MNRSVSLLLCLVAACGDNLGPELDASPPDASAAVPDARVPDASAPDASAPDAAPGPDAMPGAPDAMPALDAAPPDAVPLDAAPPDAVPPDAFPGNANLAALGTSGPFDLAPAFDPALTSYTLTVSPLVQEVRVTATSEDPGATLRIDGAVASSGVLSDPIALGAGNTVISVQVQAPEGLVRTYDITVSRAAAPSQRVYGKASNAESLDQFGWSIALSGDVLAVGAPFEDSNATGVDGPNNNSAPDAGAAYVFRRSGGVWAQEAYLKASNTFNGDNFGLGVAVSGDTVAVSAYREDSSATGINGDQASNAAADAGAVYVFRRSDGVWAQEAYVKASNTGAGDEFGHAVALSGDTLAVGARREASSATGVNGDDANNDAAASGAVYVYTRTGTTWAQQAYVKASNTGVSDEFGATLALSDNLLVVGA
ncbi:MAG TPA: cadherin-like beta sandwich domain-containing protein, partial [Haliangium sp.]|nr:cadherin-like beta sandwich domain-containing protein [Haliangium sp.]